MNWLHYLLEANLYLGVFYLAYYLFLSRETYYTLNRFYLLISCVLSFVLPVLQLGILKPVEQPVTTVNFTLAPQQVNYTPMQATIETAPIFTWQNALVYGYILGAVILLTVLLIKLYSLFNLTRTENPGPNGKYKLVYINQSATAFSFFNYLFIGTKVQGSETIIRHELVHIHQKHSADIIFIELLKIVNWFNPFIYLIQYSLRTIHEYIADEKTAIAENDALAYSSFLVNNAYGLGGSSITHSFFNYNLLKKRIIMLHQKRSGSLARLKYLVALPICAGLICASTLAFSKSYGWVDIAPHRIDKSNKSSQVKRLLVTQHGVSVISDKISEQYPDGSVRYYTAYNLSNKDKVNFAKKGIKINVLSDVVIKTSEKKSTKTNAVAYGHTKTGNKYKVIWLTDKNKNLFSVIVYDKNSSRILRTEHGSTDEEIASLGRKYDFKFESLVNNLNDTAKSIPPPAPPVKVTDRRPPPPPPAPPVSYTKNGYKYSQDGYVINGKTDFRVIITEKNGNQKEYFKSKVSVADLKLLKEKYGYTFPEMEIYTKLPPPPPTQPIGTKTNKVAPKAVVIKFPPPVVNPVSPISAQSKGLPPPPPPFETVYKGLMDYLYSNVKYPTAAISSHIAGNGVVQYTLGADHKISEVNILRSTNSIFNSEIESKVKSFTGLINETAGTYSIGFMFNIAGETSEDEARKVEDKLVTMPNYSGVVSVVGHAR